MTRIFGNSADTVRRAKDPMLLARLCAMAGISHPQVALAAPEEPDRWLTKSRGGAGGAHVAPAASGRASPDGYFQRRVAGESVSALFVADGQTAGIVGLSSQWTSPTSESPFRYGGAAGPTELGAAQTEEISRSVAFIASELGLVGLNSVDFIVSSDTVWLIEVNPRLGATLDLFEPVGRALFEVHLAGCEGHAVAVPSCSEFRAAEVVYAPGDIVVPRRRRNWPDWTADRPPPGTRVASGDPLCTVLASAATVESARNQVNSRARDVVALVRDRNLERHRNHKRQSPGRRADRRPAP
jgi:predicted ATP-grasp superfamily ATP-dependent carboligase